MLKEGDRSGTSGPARHQYAICSLSRRFLLSLVILVAAGLLIRSFVRLLEVDPGFRPDHVLTVSIPLPVSRYPMLRRRLVFSTTARARPRSAGVRAAGAVTDVPLFGGSSTGFDVEGRPPAAPNECPMTDFRSATPDYFRAMGIDLAAGRDFTTNDKADAPPVAVINGPSPARFRKRKSNRQTHRPQPPDRLARIVGVVQRCPELRPRFRGETGMLASNSRTDLITGPARLRGW